MLPAPALPKKPDPGWIRIWIDGKPDRVLLVRPDGSEKIEVAVPPLVGQPSPDGKKTSYMEESGNERTIHVADVDGKNARRVSPADLVVMSNPCWSPDSRRIAFIAQRGGNGQLHVMDQDGRDLRQVTDTAGNWAWNPKFVSDGRLSYLTHGKGEARDRPAELAVFDGKVSTPVVSTPYISDYAWSADGKVVAFGKVGAMAIRDLATGNEREVVFSECDERLSRHIAVQIVWSPDGGAVACKLFCPDAGRGIQPARGAIRGMQPPLAPAMATQPFGATELFVIPRQGKPARFDAGVKLTLFDWVKEK